jgi:hypothetical protein
MVILQEIKLNGVSFCCKFTLVENFIVICPIKILNHALISNEEEIFQYCTHLTTQF